MIRAAFRLPFLAMIAAAYLAACGLARLAPGARRRCLQAASRACGRLLRLLNVRVAVMNREALPAAGAGSLIVSNHVSFIDVFVLSALAPAVFVPSLDLRDAGFFGWVTRWGGAYFVDRDNPFALRREIIDLAALLRQGFRVALFPEGTTSDGSGLLPFKTPLFEAAVRAGAPVVPVSIVYRTVDGEPLNRENRDKFFYYGNMSLARQAFGALRLKSLDVAVTVGEPQPAGGSRRKEVAAAAEGWIRSKAATLPA